MPAERGTRGVRGVSGRLMPYHSKILHVVEADLIVIGDGIAGDCNASFEATFKGDTEWNLLVVDDSVGVYARGDGSARNMFP